ncbi:MAG: hypothetical protein RLZ54_1016 [Candidatus Parcubacteria bacterium]|jgi:hypothetical protein
MNQLANELKQVVGNYENNYEIETDGEYVDLIIDDMTSTLIYDIIVLAKSLDYGFTIRPTLPSYAIKIEFYKTL